MIGENHFSDSTYVQMGQCCYLNIDQISSEFFLTNKVPLKIAGAHSNYRTDWISSRCALYRAFFELGIEYNAVRNLFKGPHQVGGLNDWTISISHSEKWGGAWIVPVANKFAIGFDLELNSRSISSGLQPEFLRADDFTLKPIQAWSLKEAIFKCLSKKMQDGLSFLDIQLSGENFLIEKVQVAGKWKQKESSGLIRSFAWREEENVMNEEYMGSTSVN